MPVLRELELVAVDADALLLDVHALQPNEAGVGSFGVGIEEFLPLLGLGAQRKVCRVRGTGVDGGFCAWLNLDEDGIIGTERLYADSHGLNDGLGIDECLPLSVFV